MLIAHFSSHESYKEGDTEVKWLALSPHSKEVLGLIISFLPICVGSLQVLRPPPTVQRHAC